MKTNSTTARPWPAGSTGLTLDAVIGGAQDRAIMAVLMVLMVTLGATGIASPYSIDEVLYLSGAFAMAEHGALSIDNGYHAFQSETLVPHLMIVGPDGRITPQYPSGIFILAWPFVEIFGGRGLAIMNGFAAAAVLWLTRSIALALFGDRAIALGAAVLLAVASFLPDYAAALWPHATALTLGLAVVRVGIRAAETEGRQALLLGLATGLIAGLALTVRVDAVLLVPPLALWLVYAARAPILTLCGAGIGYGAGLMAAAGLNYVKFGQISPLTYGRNDEGGGTSMATYEPLFAPLLLAALAAICIATACRRPGRAPLVFAGAGLLGALGGVAATMALPAFRAELVNLWHGLLVLVVDMSALFDDRSGVEGGRAEITNFWDVAKQALGQSMPWIALLLALSLSRKTAPRWHGMSLCLLLIGAVLAFFGRLAWHGGMSANMRYLLPVVPFVAMLVAFALRDLAMRAERHEAVAVLRAWGFGAMAMLAAALVAIVFFDKSLVWIRQPFATGLLALTALAALVSHWPGASGRSAARGAQVVAGAALAFSVLSAAIGDWHLTQQRRGIVQEQEAAIPWPQTPYVFVSPRPDIAVPVLGDPNGWLSVPPFDLGVLEEALRDGRRMIVFDAETADAIARNSSLLRVLETGSAAGYAEIGLDPD